MNVYFIVFSFAIQLLYQKNLKRLKVPASKAESTDRIKQMSANTVGKHFFQHEAIEKSYILL